MAAETAPIRAKTRRLKDLAITKAIDILEYPEKYSPDIYNETYQTVLKNSVPKAQEITGEDGGDLVIQISREIAVKNNLPTVQLGTPGTSTNASYTLTNTDSKG